MKAFPLKNKKFWILIVSFILLLTVTVGGTLAVLMAKTGLLTNLFTPSHVATSISETVSGTAKSDAAIVNTGDTAAYIRAAIVVNWKNEAGDVYSAAPVRDADYTLTLNLGESAWDEGSDGFYYWPSVVDPGDPTGILITNCTPLPSASVPDGYTLSVEILASGIQSAPVSVVAEQWGVTVSDDRIAK